MVLLRPASDAAGQSYRIFFVKRHSKSGFFANAHVFPGGKLDTADCAPALAAVVDVDEASAASRLGGDVDGDVAVGLHVAAVRETFEEAGVLLAACGGGEPLCVDEAGAARLDAWRARIHAGDGSLLELIEAEGLVICAGSLLPWSRWVTPDFETRRFDTRFFVAALPEGQEPLHDDRETTAGEWLSPDEALEACDARRIQLAPPTLRTLVELAALPTLPEVFAQRRPLAAIRPVAVTDGGGLILALPGDPLYPAQDPASARPNRITLLDGLWRSVRG